MMNPFRKGGWKELLTDSYRDIQRTKKRKHHIIPWIENPCVGADEEELVFHQRHEANTIELFFDLFFVANLATFTAYHSITDKESLFAYIGFFAILWATWFQITLHDVRFARDSIYERVCKTIQFVVFVGFALVGSAFDPSTKKGVNNTNFRILSYTLFMSRVLLAVQYAIVLIFTASKGYKKLMRPLSLSIITYTAAAVVFAALTPAFREGAMRNRVTYAAWWIVMFFEGIATIAISSSWRMLSFKKTHLVERMGLLTLIVIGEGAIGVTKTISRMMGKYGLDAEGSGLILCIVLVLVFLWMLYFDNHPHGHYGTIRQQIWSVLHFPFHLAIVGVVEGSQQVALARYVIKQTMKLDEKFYNVCMKLHLDGPELVNALLPTLNYFQLEYKVESERWMPTIMEDLWTVGNNTGICAPENTIGHYAAGFYPDDLFTLRYHSIGAIYASLGMKLPTDKDATQLALSSWKIVYQYYWASTLVLFFCLIIFMYLIRKSRADIFDWVSTISRGIMFILAAIFLAKSAKSDNEFIYEYLGSPAVLPTCLAMLFLVLVFDRASAWFSNRRLRRNDDSVADDHEHGHNYSDSKYEGGVSITAVNPSRTDMAYNPVPATLPMDPVSTYSAPTPQSEVHGGGYVSVDNGQYVT